MNVGTAQRFLYAFILQQRLVISQFLSSFQNPLSRKLSILTILSMVIKFNNLFNRQSVIKVNLHHVIDFVVQIKFSHVRPCIRGEPKSSYSTVRVDARPGLHDSWSLSQPARPQSPPRTLSASERRRDNLKSFKHFCVKAYARILP